MQHLALSYMEIPTLIFTAFLFAASLLKRKKHRHQKILSALIAIILAALTIDILLNLNIANIIKLSYFESLTVSEYILMYAVLIGAHYFLLEDIAVKKRTPIWLYFIPLINVCAHIGFMLFVGRLDIYTLSASGGIIADKYAYILLAIRMSILIIDFIITLVYIKRLSPASAFSHICYEIVPIIVAFIDLVYDTSFIFIAISVLLFTDYISVSHSRDLKILEQKQHLAEQEKQIALEQTKITVSQIGPHFLYNSISSIMALCKKNPDKAVNGLADFSDYLRENMRFITVDTPITFERELSHVKTYVRLEKLRFEEKLNVVYDIEVNDFLLPALSVQPLVENAIKHGIGQKETGGTVKIATRKVVGGIIVQIIDDGVGIYTVASHNEASQKEHIGIENVKSRIESLCGGTLEIESKSNIGTTVTIFLPIEN